MTTLDGQLETLVYRNDGNGFTVARFRDPRLSAAVTVVGLLPTVAPGEGMRLSGRWQRHPRFGEQFRVERWEVTLPADAESIQRYLGAGVIAGVGPGTAARLVGAFGAETLEVMAAGAEALESVPGIGPIKAQQIHQAWKSTRSARRVLALLQGSGIRPALGSRIVTLYGDQTESVLSQDPYRLLDDLPAVGFATADRLARQLGAAPEEPRRIQAGLRWELQRAASQGHCCQHRDTLVRRAAATLGLGPDTVADALAEIADSGDLVVDRRVMAPDAEVVYLPALWQAENRLALRLGALLSVPTTTDGWDRGAVVDTVSRHLAVALSDEQLQVLHHFFGHRALIVTGGPGTGKTTLVRALAALCETTALSVALTAPTGRAARRLSEVTGRPAVTLHKLLQYNLATGAFDKTADNPLDVDVVVVDEASMVDTLLAHCLVEALPMTAVLVLVGDSCQLPSVGAGNLLQDLMDSDCLPAFELTRVYRQALESAIVRNAHRVREGRLPSLESDGAGFTPDKGFYFIEEADAARAAATVVDLCRGQIPAAFDLDPVHDIQVLSPMHRGAVGTVALNLSLQAALNPPADDGDDPVDGGYRLGDKVMHLRNNYRKEVFNGEIGTVVGIGGSQGGAAVDFDGRRVVYRPEELDELSLAYAISVHKAQGSEYPAVILPLMTEHRFMLQRNLLYTALTRARQLAVLVGSRRALEIALANDRPNRRLTGLKARLQAIFA